MISLQEAIHQIEQLERKVKLWQYLFEEEQRVATGFRELSYRYKELLDEKKKTSIPEHVVTTYPLT